MATVTGNVTIGGVAYPVTADITLPSPTSTVWPGPGNTGVPAGVKLTPVHDMVVTVAGTVLDGLDISGTLTINADDVTVRRCRVRGSAYAIIRVADTARRVVIEDVTVDGMGAAAGTPNSGGIIGPATVTRCDISGVENGVVPGSGSRITATWIHDLGAPGSPHIDGIQIDGDRADIIVADCFVDMSEWDQTATVMVDNYAGGVDKVTVRGCRLLGGGYTVYSDGKFGGGPMTNIAFKQNRLGKGGWGYALVRDSAPVWAGNVDDATGATIPAP